MKFIKIIKNNFLLIARLFILSFPRRSSTDVAPALGDKESGVFSSNLDPRIREDDRGGYLPKKLKSYKLLSFVPYLFALFLKNLQPATYHSFKPKGSQSLNGLQPSHGFTLIETLVAISILMIAVASPLTIAQKGLSSAIYAKDQVIASYLAQDAIEYLRNLSDQNVASGADWLNGIEDGNNCGNSCTVDTSISFGIKKCTAVGSCYKLDYDGSVYKQLATEHGNSQFTRSVKVAEISPKGKEALITVTMSWEDKGKSRSLIVNTRIFKWR